MILAWLNHKKYEVCVMDRAGVCSTSDAYIKPQIKSSNKRPTTII